GLCKEHGISLVGTRPAPVRRGVIIEDALQAEKTRPFTEADLTVPIALMFGREADGIGEQAAAEADQLLYIPMSEAVDSLNVAAAAAILLYEAARQRGFRELQ